MAKIAGTGGKTDQSDAKASFESHAAAAIRVDKISGREPGLEAAGTYAYEVGLSGERVVRTNLDAGEQIIFTATPAGWAPANLKPSHRAFLEGVRTRPSPRLNNEEYQAGVAFYDKLRAELEAKHLGKHVTIDVMTGRYAVASSDLDAVYEFEQKFGPAKTLTFEIG